MKTKKLVKYQVVEELSIDDLNHTVNNYIETCKYLIVELIGGVTIYTDAKGIVGYCQTLAFYEID